MSEFRIEKRITSCLVTKNLIKDIEEYLFNQLPSIVDIPKEKIKESYTISITDNIGTEIIQTISDFGYPIFDDKTKGLNIQISVFSSKRFTLKLDFDKTYFLYSKIEMYYEATNPREILTGVLERIIKIIKRKKTINKYFWPIPFIWLYLGSLEAILLAGIITSIREEQYSKTLILGSILILCLLYSLAGFLNKYTSFESNNYNRMKTLSNFLFWGFISFIVFDIIFIILRKKILGL